MTTEEFNEHLEQTDTYLRLLKDATNLVAGHEVEEHVQETLLAPAKNLSTFRGDSTLNTWLHAILQNKVRDHIEGRQRQRRERALARGWSGRRHERTEVPPSFDG